MGTAIDHPVPDWVKPPFVFLTSGHYDAQPWASECPDVKNYKWRLNPVWHRMLYSCTHMATVGVKGLRRAADLTVIMNNRLRATVIWLPMATTTVPFVGAEAGVVVHTILQSKAFIYTWYECCPVTDFSLVLLLLLYFCSLRINLIYTLAIVSDDVKRRQAFEAEAEGQFSESI